MPACLKYRKKTGREGGGGGGKKNSEKRVLSYLNVKRHASRCFRRARSSRTLSCPKGTRYSGRAYFLRNFKKAKCMQGHLAEETLMTIASSHRWHFFCFVDKKKKQWILAVAVVESSKSNKVDVFNFLPQPNSTRSTMKSALRLDELLAVPRFKVMPVGWNQFFGYVLISCLTLSDRNCES